MQNEFSDDFLYLLSELNYCVAQIGQPVAGNYLYAHRDPQFPNAQIDPKMVKKRANLIHAAAGKKNMLEIGFNAGHSALIALYHSEVVLYAVDPCIHAYTPYAAEFLSNHFPGRFYFMRGGSEHVLPWLAVQHPQLRFDMIHIDGNHEKPFVETDFYNAMRVAQTPCDILFDDTGNRYPYTQECIRRFIAQGLAEEIPAPTMYMHEAGNKLVRIPPSAMR